jgi:hypothetical protein
MRILRDVCGIPGLDVVLDAFTADVERRLFKSQELHPPAGLYKRVHCSTAKVFSHKLKPVDPLT